MENITDKGEDIKYGISELPEISEPIKKYLHHAIN